MADRFKSLAVKYLRLAETCSDPAEATSLRLRAADCMEKATRSGTGTTQQQQQIQPGKKEE